ncbi:hypothetical protein AURDEDRAFT_112081 [Auricularia subglabra TFB-10046 SS5]|nr:hypothetical protein AURDEDRAFT_112081 [Auricularia subglabra TFB-10046 SS5]
MDANTLSTILGQRGSVECEHSDDVLVLRVCMDNEPVLRINLAKTASPEAVGSVIAMSRPGNIPSFAILPPVAFVPA